MKLDDTLFTLKLTPNLAHCLSVYGIAREVSALTGATLKTPEFKSLAAQVPDTLPVAVHATDLCGRFSGRVVKGVNPKAQTPAWMVDRLARCGQRSVSPLVDISNYVMFELGRPSHIFDLNKIHGGLQVRWGRADESLKLLNGSTVTVDGKVGVIADDAQVKGGVLWVSKPKFRGSWLYTNPNYHIGDINLYYIDIRNNACERVSAYRRLQP